jgi:hypothetical protein
MLDAPPSALMALGWIGAGFEIDRWFFWAIDFWTDENKGGRGDVDPLETAETFHNWLGDACLGDGLLVYPGDTRPPLDRHRVEGVGFLASMRLKRLRRGLQDAAILALAARADLRAALQQLDAALPHALDEVSPEAARGWPDDTAGFARARTALRALVPDDAAMSTAEARDSLRRLARARLAEDRRRGPEPVTTSPASTWSGLVALAALLAVLAVLARR